MTTLTHIHDPIHRQLIHHLDGDQPRIWCFTNYSSSFIIYYCFSFIVAARMRFKPEAKQSFKQHFKLQLEQHKHLLIASVTLILLGLPRLIISFISRCMRSPHEPCLYLIDYSLLFIPTMSTFFVFILPSTIYKKEFDRRIHKTIRKFCLQP